MGEQFRLPRPIDLKSPEDNDPEKKLILFYLIILVRHLAALLHTTKWYSNHEPDGRVVFEIEIDWFDVHPHIVSVQFDSDRRGIFFAMTTLV